VRAVDDLKVFVRRASTTGRIKSRGQNRSC